MEWTSEIVVNIKRPLVSVVMPVYNMENYLDEAIESILSQSLAAFELIIINDGSTDNSLDLLERWAKKDARIRLYNQVNRGRSFSRNRGLELASSEFVAMMDPDDISLPERLELSYQLLQKYDDVVAVSGQYQRVCMYGVKLRNSSRSVPLEHDEIVKNLLDDDGSVFHQSASMIRKTIAKSVGGYNLDYEMGEDVDLFLKMALKGRLQNLPELFLYYREHAQAITKQRVSPALLQNCKKRLASARADRGLTLDDSFVHWLETFPNKEAGEYWLSWGWNALINGRKGIARRYAIKLFFEEPFNSDTWTFIYCAVRGR